MLLVEDEAPVATALAHMMNDWDIRVDVAASLPQLEAMLPTLARPDLMVTDYRLPEGRTGGDAIAAVLRRWKVPAIILTGDTADYRLRHARKLGHPMLYKPVIPAGS